MKHDPASLAGQITELKRERALRANVYPKLIAAGRLDPSAAQRQTQALDAAIATLVALAEGQQSQDH
jgi:hypothetical protein